MLIILVVDCGDTNWPNLSCYFPCLAFYFGACLVLFTDMHPAVLAYFPFLLLVRCIWALFSNWYACFVKNVTSFSVVSLAIGKIQFDYFLILWLKQSFLWLIKCSPSPPMINKRKQEVIVIVMVLSSNAKCSNSNLYLHG